MKISIFTPTHNARFLEESYRAICEQEIREGDDWEWIVLLNNGAKFEPRDRVKIVHDDTGIQDVGYLKRLACQHATGEVLLELDHDDLLLPGALKAVGEAFADNEVSFVYSNAVSTDVRNGQPLVWGGEFGWRYRPYAGNNQEAISPVANPQNLSRIWFAPNHLRAWRATAYWKMGGHDATMKIADDHDLLCRTYLTGAKMVHMDKPLYLYRVHGDNTWLKHQDEIQAKMWGVFERYLEPMMMKWSKDQGLNCIDLCGGVNPVLGYLSVDLANADITADLNERWPFADSSLGLIRAHDAVEHLRDPVRTMNEAYRSLAHGGVLDILVPSTDGQGAFCDPTHVSFWNYRSFRYYTDLAYRKFLAAAKCRFQVLRVADVKGWEGMPYVSAQLMAVKDHPAPGRRYHGELLV